MPQLAIQHCHELLPASAPPRMLLPFVLSYRRVKLPAREPSQNLTEHAAYSCHGRASFMPVVSVLVEPEPTLAGSLPVPSFTPPTVLQIPENLICTRVISLTSAGIALSLFPDGQADTVTFGTSLAHHKFCRPGS